MADEVRFENCPPYGDDYTGCTCGLLQLLGFHNRIGRTIKTASYVRLRTDPEKISSKKCKDHEISDISVTKKDQVVLFQKKEKDRVLRANSYKRNIKAWIKKHINRKSNKKQKKCPGSPRVSRTSSIQKPSFIQPKENIKELGRTLLDGVLHKIPYGHKVPEEIIKGNNKLFRSLSADYDKNEGENKYKRNLSSPAIVFESKNGGKIEDNLVNNFEELKGGNENCEGKEGMVLVEDENLGFEILDLKDEDFESNLLAVTDSESEIEEKIETDSESGIETEEKIETGLESEIEEKSETDLESEIEEGTEMNLNLEEKDISLSPKIESLPNLLKQLGLDLDTTQTQFEQKEEKLPILDSVTLEDFSKIWDQINQIEFSKFDCNLMSLDLILILDLIDQVYKEVYTNPSETIHWFLNYKSKLDSKSLENIVLKEVQERATWHLIATKECSDEADDIIGNWDFMRYDDFFNLRGEIENMVGELERLVLDDLIEDLVVR